MRKICISFIILILIFANQVFAVEKWDIENKKREEAYKNALEEWLTPFMSEDTPYEERIIEYTSSGYGGDFDENGKLKSHISFDVTPYSENTIWNKHKNICFTVFYVDENGDYVLESISRMPENYDKFLERFEEYEKNKDSEVEVQAVQGEQEHLNSNQEIEKISNRIFTVSLIVFIALIVLVITKFVLKIQINKMKK